MFIKAAGSLCFSALASFNNTQQTRDSLSIQQWASVESTLDQCLVFPGIVFFYFIQPSLLTDNVSFWRGAIHGLSGKLHK